MNQHQCESDKECLLTVKEDGAEEKYCGSGVYCVAASCIIVVSPQASSEFESKMALT